MTPALSQALASLQGGQVEQAVVQLNRIVASAPGDAEAHGWLAIGLARMRQWPKAEAAIQRALQLRPAQVSFYLTAANIQQDLGRLEAAVELLRQAVHLNPTFAEAQNNLGIVLSDLGRLDEAVEVFHAAIRLKPQYARAHANLAAAQMRLSRFEEALQSARQAASLQPQYAHAHHLMGNALSALGRLPEAEEALRRALALHPGFAESAVLLSKTLLKQRRHQEAADVVQAALPNAPQSAELWTVQGNVAAERDEIPVALAAYQRALELKPGDVATTVRAALLLPSIYQNDAHLEACRARFTQGVAYLQAHADDLVSNLARERFGEAAPSNFLLAYQGRNDRDLQRGYADFVQKAVTRAFPAQTDAQPAKAVAGRRIRVGFCSRFFFTSTVGNYFASWITGLDRDRFEVFVYHTHVVNDELTRRVRAAADHFEQMEENPTYFRSAILADRLDVLVFPEQGMDQTSFLLAAMRLAPRQLCGWGHPVTPGHRTLDYYVSCAAMEPVEAQQHYNEKLLTLPGIGTSYARPSVSPEMAVRTRADYQLPEDKCLYFFPQSLFKVHPANDALLVDVLAGDPEGVLVMFAGQNQDITQKFIARLSATFAARGLSPQGRVRILPGFGHDEYKRINQLCDLMLDSLHWSGGNTSLDALAVGLPVVTLPGEFMRGRQSMAMLKLLGIPELIATSHKDYVAIALKLANDVAWRRQMSDKIVANLGKLFDDPAPPRAFGALLEELCAQDVSAS